MAKTVALRWQGNGKFSNPWPMKRVLLLVRQHLHRISDASMAWKIGGVDCRVEPQSSLFAMLLCIGDAEENLSLIDEDRQVSYKALRKT